MAKTYSEYKQLHLGTADSSPARPGGPNTVEWERIKLNDLPDYLAKHELRVIGGDSTTWPPTIYTEMEG
jgi:hypothetical protein